MDSNEGTFDPLSLHKYLYAGNDPVNRTDPSGEQFSLSGLAVSIAISGVLNATIGYINGQTALGSIAENFIIGGLEGAVLYGASAVAIRAFVQLGRFVRVSRLGVVLPKF